MAMRLRHSIDQRLSQELRITPQMILLNRILQLQTLDLRQEIEQNLIENPALEMIEDALCPKCNEPLGEGGDCGSCESDFSTMSNETQDAKFHRFDDLIANWDSGHFEDSTMNERQSQDDEFDPLSNTSGDGDFRDEIKRTYLITYTHESDELDDAVSFMIERIDDKGLLQISDDEISDELGLEISKISQIRANLTRLDPVGLGAFSVSDALLAQINELENTLNRDLTLEKHIITRYRDLLARSSIEKIAKGTNSDVKRVKEAVEFIKENLYAYPGDFFDSQISSEISPDMYPEPDVIIREVDGEFYPEIVDSGLPNFRISGYYLDAYNKLKSGGGSEFTNEEKRQIRQYFERAQFFLDCINQRRETIIQICNFLIEYQRDFLVGGIRKLKDLTRDKVAKEVGFHPSTISRALKDKYVQLPDRQIYSFDIFFDYQKVMVLVIKEILQKYESSQNLLSDEMIAEKMKELGFEVARRTVAKYRERGKIPPKNVRKRNLIINSEKP